MITFPPEKLVPVFPEYSDFSYIASGSYKSVYRVKNNATGDEVLKIVPLPGLGKSEEDDARHQQELGRIQRETSILGKCSSQFLVKLGKLIPQCYEIDGQSCFAYTEEFLKGQELASIIRKGETLPSESEVKKLLRCLISAIQVLWNEHRIVHRDIKPGNIFATNNPERPYVLIDLGIAYDASIPGLTLRKSDIPHTPLYVAPEMLDINFRDTISYRSDLYSAALSAYEFSAGKHPLIRQGDDLRRTYTRVLTQEVEPLEKSRNDFSLELCKLINQLLKKSPPLRPANIPLLLKQLTD